MSKKDMSLKVGNVYILDMYRPHWSVGRVRCDYCMQWQYRMWPTDTGYTWCEDCLEFTKVEDID